MASALRRFYAVLGLVVAAGAIVALTLATPLLGTRADFSAYNVGWNGASELAIKLHGTGAFTPLLSAANDESGLSIVPVPLGSTPADPQTSAILIIGPRSAYTPAELDYLRTFVDAGGLLLVADDFGTGNDVLAGIGARTRIAPSPVLDFAFAKRPEFTVAIDFADHPLLDGVERMLLNYPASLTPAEGAMVLANTTEAAWVDADQNGLRDPGEAGGPFAWLAIEDVGEGSVIVLADPSALINGMRPFAHNARFVDNLVDLVAGSREQVLVDESHRGNADPLAFTGLRMRTLSPIGQLVIVGAVTGLVLVVATGALATPLRWTRDRLGALLAGAEDAPARRPLIERARERHPDWDETTLSEIVSRWEQEKA